MAKKERLKTALSLSCLALWLAFGAPAWAGDAAEFRNHGFSSDEKGRYFAFEEFGVQDGSGFPYSNIFIVDLEKDAWVEGTPVRVRLDDEKHDLLTARFKAFETATPLMQHHEITRSGILLAASPIYETGDKTVLEFRHLTSTFLLTSNQTYRLELKSFNLKDTNDCGFDNGMIKGYNLSMITPTGEFIALHDEGAVPKSRGCPILYQLIAVYAPEQDFIDHYGVALIGYFTRGFEGPDLRYLAVPIKF